ncbi:AraC family transcriptional regulator [Aeromicrobium sp. Sec7.5]|uniref:AraC family transcriptional regulator n=1 Tax=Aeromicrobium sp. Sec7.5 TaxID=3121276 RepID=UPI002FE4C48D
MASLIRATNLWGYAEVVRELGGDPDELCARFHLPAGVAREQEAFVAFDAFVRCLEAAATELACPDFGLRVSKWQGLDILGPVAVIARNAPTVHDGLTSVARYLYVHSPALELAMQPRPAGAGLRFTYTVRESTLTHLRQGYELSMANAARIVRLLGGAGAGPSLVSFLHPRQGPQAAYEEALGCPVRFEQPWCGFEIGADLATRSIDGSHPETRRMATMYLESTYAPGSATWNQRVAELARRLLPTGNCTATAIAEQLAVHPRTLQRLLAAEGDRCQDVIERVRRDQAAAYLADPRLHLSQIAGLLGYSEQSTLNRSSRRWFGTTPRQYRAEVTRSAP